MEASQTNLIVGSTAAEASSRNARVTLFVCANCARGGLLPTGRLGRTAALAAAWPGTVQQVQVPCTGRLQPEHLLRAFEGGADLVGVIACAGDNCHYLEGSCRAGKRSKYVGAILDEIGLGSGRLMLFHLPGSAKEDMAAGMLGSPGAGAAQAGQAISDAELAGQVQAIAAQIGERLRALPPSPLRPPTPVAEPVEVSEVEEAEENDD